MTFTEITYHMFQGGGLLVPLVHTSTAQTIMMLVGALLSMSLAYLLGSLNFAIILSQKEYHQDIRSFGSKNAGMTNMMRTYGKKAAMMTLGGDMLKAVVASLLGYALLGMFGAYIAGLFCIIGHMFPVYYGFRGGKGVVTVATSILMCDIGYFPFPVIFLTLLLCFVLIVLATKYISLGSVMCMLLYPIFLDRFSRIFYDHPSPFSIFSILMAALVIVKHHENISRLLKGQESKFSFKKSKTPAEAQELIASDTANESTEADTQDLPVQTAIKRKNASKHYGKKKK